MSELTPRQIVAELDRHIIGQDAAKRSVAIALRNRWRWKQLPDDLRRDVTPKNILMIGPTGVGKTEITRRLAQLTGAPFVKVEASKYTEVGYYGRDVESMIRDLVDAAIHMVREQKQAEVQEEAAAKAEERLLDMLVPPADWTPGRIPKRRRGPSNGMNGLVRNSARCLPTGNSKTASSMSTSNNDSHPFRSSRPRRSEHARAFHATPGQRSRTAGFGSQEGADRTGSRGTAR